LLAKGRGVPSGWKLLGHNPIRKTGNLNPSTKKTNSQNPPPQTRFLKRFTKRLKGGQRQSSGVKGRFNEKGQKGPYLVTKKKWVLGKQGGERHGRHAKEGPGT